MAETPKEDLPTIDVFKRTALLERLNTTCQSCHTPGVRFSGSNVPGIAVYSCPHCGEFFRGAESEDWIDVTTPRHGG